MSTGNSSSCITKFSFKIIFERAIKENMAQGEGESFSTWARLSQLREETREAINLLGVTNDDAGLADLQSLSADDLKEEGFNVGQRLEIERILGFKFKINAAATSSAQGRAKRPRGGKMVSVWPEIELRTLPLLTKPFIGSYVTLIVLAIASIYGSTAIDEAVRMMIVDYVLLDVLWRNKMALEPSELGALEQMLLDMLPQATLSTGTSWYKSLKSRKQEMSRRNPRPTVRVLDSPEWGFFSEQWPSTPKLSLQGVGLGRLSPDRFSTIEDRATSIKCGQTPTISFEEISEFGGSIW